MALIIKALNLHFHTNISSFLSVLMVLSFCHFAVALGEGHLTQDSTWNAGSGIFGATKTLISTNIFSFSEKYSNNSFPSSHWSFILLKEHSYRYSCEVNLVTEQKIMGNLKEKNGKVLTVTECNKYDKTFMGLHTCKEVIIRECLELWSY